MSETTTPVVENFNFDLPKNRSNVIKVIGIGGGGGNAINYMFQQGIMGVDFVICNTDSQALEKSGVPIKIQLGVSLTEGLGAGANPDVGRRAAQESLEDITTLLSTQTKMVFITAGMGGGTGTGAAPIIAKMAKEMDILTVGIVTMPFQFEGKIRLEQAQRGLEEIKSCVDALIVINNNKLREVYGNLGFKAGFAKADEVLATAARGIAEVITHHYTQNIDLKDAKTVLSNSGSAIMGSATAEGENRAQESIVKALDSPLLNDNKITGCKNVLLLIVSGEEEITIDEIGEINDFIQTEAGNNTNIIMGVGDDPSLGRNISVTIIATGFNSEQQHEIVNTEARKIIHTLEEDQPLVHDLSKPDAPESLFDTPLSSLTEEEPIVKYNLENDEHLEKVNAIAEEDQVLEDSPNEITQEMINEIEVIDHEVVLPLNQIEVIDAAIIQPELNIPALTLEETEQKDEETDLFLETPEETYSDSEEEFIFNEISPALNEIDVVDHEVVGNENDPQIQFEFELPLSESPTHELIEPPTEKDSHISHLDEQSEECSVEEAMEEKEDALALKVIEKEDVPKETIRPAAQQSPFDQSIRESISKQNEMRKEQLKQFNYTFKNNLSRIEEMERQPAYKRLGFELDAPSEDQSTSNYTLDYDSNDDIQLRSNNSFLHDNVD